MTTKRQQQAQNTKQLILDTAQRLIGERGYEDITVEDVAKECGIAKGTMYHYFSGKVDLFINLEHMRFQEISRVVEAMEIQGAEKNCAAL